ncbi:hypothetical protein Avbf_15206 [Armadillidium vulgare]|nr:hypothetical protein Avbf_15206 [Armadillidium vulgare]
MSLQKENDEYWLYNMDEEKIPLQVLKNIPIDDIFTQETHTSIDSSTGPLWRATYITNDDHKNESNNFKSNLMFTFDHVVADATTAFSICNSFLKVLDDVMGDNVQKSYDFGQLSDGQETEEITEQRIEYLKKNPDYFNEIKAFLTKFDSQKIWLMDLFPAPKVSEKKTKYIFGEIDEETTGKLLKVFKSKGISFHSGFSSALNWVLMDMLIENGLPYEEIELPTEHAINMRRYWKNHSSIQLGSHVGLMKILSKTDKNIGANFWDYAKEFNKTLKSAIENMQVIDFNVQQVFSDFGGPQVDSSKLSESYLNKSYYCSTNLGDLSSILQGRGNHVRIKSFKRGASGHCANYPFIPYFQTYEGRLIYSIAYSIHLVTDDLINLLVDKMVNKLNIISN